MAANTEHWRDRFIAKSEAISDAWDVGKAWAARAAEVILFLCMVFNLLEMFPILPDWFGNVVLIVQSITLDVAGFGLKTMGDHARRRGNEKAANAATRMGWTLIILMLVTVSLVTLSLLIPQTKDIVDWIEKVLILARVGVTVFYAHIVHGLRQASLAYENEVSTLREQVSTLQQEVSTLRPQVDSGQQEVDTLRGQLAEKIKEVDTLQSKLSTVQQKAFMLEADLNAGEGSTSTLRKQLNEALIEAEALRAQLEGKQRESDGLREQLQSERDWQESRVSNLQQELEAEQASAATLRQQFNTVKIEAEDLRGQVESRQRELERVHTELSTEQQKVSTLRKKLDTLQVSTLAKSASGGQTKTKSGHSRTVGSGHEEVDSGQGKVVHLDTTRSRRNGQDEEELAERIKELLTGNPQLSDRAIANQLQCSPTTVGKKRKAMGMERNEGSAVNE